MRLHELFEQIDQEEANKVLQSLISTNDPAAKHFMKTMSNPVHKTIDSAQRAAEQMARQELAKKSERERKKIEKQRELLKKQDRAASDAQAKEPQKAEKPKFSGSKISLDKVPSKAKGALGQIQKAWQSGIKTADEFTLARKT